MKNGAMNKRAAGEKKPNKSSRRLQVCFLILIIGVCLVSVPRYSALVDRVASAEGADVLLIDPGHGGMDGGAESAEGVPEKDINLAIAMEVRLLAEADGWRVIMTRDKDQGLYKEQGSIRSMKSQDLRQRKQIIDKVEPSATVSIHLNSFKEDRTVHGAQVFYPEGGEASKALAEMIQREIKQRINDGTDRVPLVKRDVLIFKNPKTPIVIVECGFLSNREEAKLLEDEKYQKEMAGCIYEGIMKFTNKMPENGPEIVDSHPINRGLNKAGIIVT